MSYQTDAGWRLEHSYAGLPASLHTGVMPEPVGQPRLVLLNKPLATDLGLDAAGLASEEGALILAGNRLPPGARPIAQAYAGHQFGHFTVLGDGRAVLLGEQITPDGRRFDLQFKGSGRTPFSRGGDGRAALGPMLREYVISEAMHALGVPTTRSLAVVASGETVRRQTPLPGAVLTRVAASHIRIGTFEWAAARRDHEALAALVDHTLARHYAGTDDDPSGAAEPPALRLLAAASRRLASLVARWQAIGFIHGVMNTDNIALSGETIDYGPCAFMDEHDPATVFSSIDHRGRYAYGNQPAIMQWNLARLAEALLPLIDPDEPRAIELATAVLEQFPGRFEQQWLHLMASKLGLSEPQSGDRQLVDRWLDMLTAAGADFTNSFRLLTETAAAGPDGPDRATDHTSDWPGTADLVRQPEFAGWMDDWKQRVGRQTEADPWARAAESMQRNNPAVIARNHLVEHALDAAEQQADFTPLTRLLEVLRDPWQARPDHADHRRPPRPEERVTATFCGT